MRERSKWVEVEGQHTDIVRGVKMGMHDDSFSSVGPSKTTGKRGFAMATLFKADSLVELIRPQNPRAVSRSLNSAGRNAPPSTPIKNISDKKKRYGDALVIVIIHNVFDDHHYSLGATRCRSPVPYQI